MFPTVKQYHLKLNTDFTISRMCPIYLWTAGSAQKPAVRGKHGPLGPHREPSSGAWGWAGSDILSAGQKEIHSYSMCINSKVS